MDDALQNFKNFESEFDALSNSLQKKIDSLGQVKDPESFSAVIQEAEQDAYDAENAIKNIERDVRHYPFNLKSKCQQRLQELQSKLEGQKEELKRRARGGGSDVKGAPANNISRSDRTNWREQRTRLLGAKEVVDSTSQSLDRTMNAIEETTETGKHTANQLQSQRELMKNARDNLREADDFLARSRSTLLRMRRRLVTNKLISGLIILLELGLIVLIIY